MNWTLTAIELHNKSNLTLNYSTFPTRLTTKLRRVHLGTSEQDHPEEELLRFALISRIDLTKSCFFKS
jgi:hypothetical protein